MKVPATFSITPTEKPPTTAPPGLVRPPTTAAAKPYSRIPSIMLGSRNTTGAKHAGDRADRRRHAPAERDHPADANAGEPRGFRVGGGGAHGEADAGVAEEQIEERQKPERHRDHAAVMRADQAAAEQGTRTERGGKAL